MFIIGLLLGILYMLVAIGLSRNPQADRLKVVNGMTFFWHMRFRGETVETFTSFRLSMVKFLFATKILLKGTK